MFDVVASFGERLSALIVAAYIERFRPARFADAREFVITDDQFTHANVIFSKTNRASRRYFAPLLRPGRRRVIPVVTGFVGSTVDGRTTTIGRNGSDYTAAIVGAVRGAIGQVDPEFYFDARQVDTIGDDRVVLHHATVTTCTQPVPYWSFPDACH